MQNVSIRKAGDLPVEMRLAVERLLGRQVDADEEVSVSAIPPQQVAPREDRAVMAQRLNALLDRRAEKIRNVPGEELDAAIDKAVDDVRHSHG